MNRDALRISATLQESFRFWLDQEDSEFADKVEKELLGKIRGEFTWTPAMRRGSAYHACLERPQRALSGYYERDGFRFTENAVDAMLGKLLPSGMFEVKTTKSILIAQPQFNEVVLVAKCDHIVGSHIDDFKLSEKFDSEKYMASIQWKLYCWLFGADSFTYHVAVVDEDENENVVDVKSIESLNVFPYPKLEEDCRELVRDFISFLYARGLDGYLRQKPVYAGAAR